MGLSAWAGEGKRMKRGDKQVEMFIFIGIEEALHERVIFHIVIAWLLEQEVT